MKKILIATTLINSSAGILAETAFANEYNIEENVNTKKTRETILKGKVIKVKSNDALNVREKSNADSKVLFTLKNGEIVTILNKETNGWLQINKDGKTGYVNGSYIETYTETVTNATVTEDINLRKTASWSAEKITVIKKNENVSVISKGSEWTKISYNGLEGYAPTKYVSENTSSSGNTSNSGNNTTTPVQTSTAKTTADINLRKSASWSGEIIKVVSKNQTVTVLSKGSEWTKVSIGSNEGYVPTNYLEFTTTDNSSSGDSNNSNTGSNDSNTGNTNTGNNTGNTVVTGPGAGITESPINSKGKVIKISSNDVLNVRKQANASSEIVTTIKLNQSVNLTKKTSNGWYKVEANGVEGYVNGVYIEITQSLNAQTGIKYTTTDMVNLRDSNSWSANILTTLKKGETVEVLEKGSEWSKVVFNQTIGYVPTNYLEIVENSTQTPSEKIGKIGTVKASDLNIRTGPSTSYNIISKVYKGDTILILDESTDGWYKVETITGVIGWCSGSYIENIREGSLQSYGLSDDEKINSVIAVAMEQLGKPYSYGSTGPDSFDCSGLSYYAFKNGAGITLPRTSKEQATAGREVSVSELKVGDLIFFNTSGSGISHLGIYIGNNEMIHAPSSGKSVEVTKMNTNYWSSRIVTARRIIG
jgi:uncharacterized protein YgiM (DUF1202 family)